jgi:DNA replication licensing factor MCM6
MSSIVDALMSDNAEHRDAAQKKDSLQPPNRQTPQRSSPRPQGPPSESNGPVSDAEGYPDDEVVGTRGTDRNRPKNPMDRAIPKVTDEIGERVADVFEEFLDK